MSYQPGAKVQIGGDTVMDLTQDTVTPSDVKNGVTFHDRSGAAQQGSLITHNVYDGLNSFSTDDALSANQGRVLNEKLSGIKFVSFQISSGVSVTLNLANTFRGILFCSSVYGVSAGVFNVVSNNAGGVSASALAGGSDITFNTTVNNKITVSSNNYTVCTLMILLSEASIAS